jgi:uncharacterized protein YdcH (DUF465 family)
LIRVGNWANIFVTERPRADKKVGRRAAARTQHSTHLKGELSDMETTNTDGLKEQLIAVDPEFRELAREHGRYEQRLSELSSLQYPSDEEQLEEVTLKKKKLAVKDQMQAIILKHQSAGSTAH